MRSRTRSQRARVEGVAQRSPRRPVNKGRKTLNGSARASGALAGRSEREPAFIATSSPYDLSGAEEYPGE